VIKENKKIILGVIKILGLVLILTALYLYGKQLNDNWNYLSTSNIHFDFFWAFLSLLSICFCYLCITLVWYLIINSINKKKKSINFFQAIALYNSSQLAKYIPGKIWGYVLQASILKKFGINKSSTIYLNLLISFLYILYSFYFGFLFFLINIKINLYLACSIWFIFLIFFLCTNTIYILNKILIRLLLFFGKHFFIFNIDKNIFMKINIVILISVLFFGLAGFASALAIGLDISPELIFLLISAVIFSDAIGFIVIFSPGGLGIREIILFKLLQLSGLGIASVFIPIVARLSNMLADLLLGSLAFFLLYKVQAKKVILEF
jgi:uncharacterized membrane protein YbhN (UPF0104 family)